MSTSIYVFGKLFLNLGYNLYKNKTLDDDVKVLSACVSCGTMLSSWDSQ